MKTTVRVFRYIVLIAPFLVANTAHAYIGPGAGLGAIAVTVALVLGVLLLFAGLVWYPLKRLLKGKSGGATKDKGGNESEIK